MSFWKPREIINKEYMKTGVCVFVFVTPLFLIERTGDWTITVDFDVIQEGSLPCPNCGENLEFDLSCLEDDECDCGCCE